MSISLLTNWWEVLTRAWSMRLIAVAFLLQLVESLIPFIGDYLPRWLTVIVLIAAAVSRLVDQTNLEPK